VLPGTHRVAARLELPKEKGPTVGAPAPLPLRPPTPAAHDAEEADDVDPKNADRRKQRELSQHTVEKKEPIEKEFALDRRPRWGPVYYRVR